MTGARRGCRFAIGVLGLCLALLGAAASASDAGPPPPYPEFRAKYEALINGFHVADAEFTLTRNDRGEYIYRSESEARGLARLFGTRSSTESSRWRYTVNGIEVLEYISEKPGGDADDNEHLVYDWENHRVENISPLDPWSIELPDGTLDKMVMQLAMLFDLRNGKKVFEYHVPRQGRIKTYHFALVGEDVTELEGLGSFRTLKLMRTDDKKDQSWVWSAPDLNYFPVHFLKKKKGGLKIDLILRKLEFIEAESKANGGAIASTSTAAEQDFTPRGKTQAP